MVSSGPRVKYFEKRFLFNYITIYKISNLKPRKPEVKTLRQGVVLDSTNSVEHDSPKAETTYIV